MTRGLLRLCCQQGDALLQVAKPVHPLRLFSGSVKLLQKDGKPATAVKGIPYKNLVIGVPKERWTNEKRVSVTPVVAGTLIKKGFNVQVESGAGFDAKFRDADYEAAGAKIVDGRTAFQTDIVLKVRQPAELEIPQLREASTLISFLYPAQNKDLIDKLAQRKINAFAMDAIPRISRAQVFDALSSMANISGYRAVIEAANRSGRPAEWAPSCVRSTHGRP